MSAVTVSPNFQVTIPKAIRETLGLLPGQELQVFAYGDRIEFIPVKPVEQMRGFLQDINTRVPRERDRMSYLTYDHS
jgi:AbrB family looped-hinge helix DNA binding protein